VYSSTFLETANGASVLWATLLCGLMFIIIVIGG
jgi:hypothetical protein